MDFLPRAKLLMRKEWQEIWNCCVYLLYPQLRSVSDTTIKPSLLLTMATGNSRPETGKFPPPSTKILKYSKTSHKRTFRSVNSSNFAGFSRTALSGLQTERFFIEKNHQQAKSVLYSFITNILGMHNCTRDEMPFAALRSTAWNEE